MRISKDVEFYFSLLLSEQKKLWTRSCPKRGLAQVWRRSPLDDMSSFLNYSALLQVPFSHAADYG